jgi:hypothetical protein
VGFQLQLVHLFFGKVFFVYTDIQVIYEFGKGAAGLTAELDAFLIVISAVSFCDIVRQRCGYPPHLAREVVFFLVRQLFDQDIDSLPKIPRSLVEFEILESSVGHSHWRSN